MGLAVLARPGSGPGARADADALIREARRRQRRRYVAAAVATGVLIAAAAAVVAASRSGSGARVRGDAVRAGVARAVRPALGLRLPGAGTIVVVWPIGYPTFTQYGGPPAYVDKLDSGRHWLAQIPGSIGCDCRPDLISAGGRLVYPSAGGTTAIPATLRGRPRVLGATQFFAPSAAPGQVWLIHYSHGYEGPGPVLVSPVPVAGGRPGPELTLPARTVFVIRGTDAGFLVQLRPYVLALWRPGSLPHPLPSAPADGITDGFDASARLVAYGSGCRVRETARDAGGYGYDLCPVLRVLDVVTGQLRSFAPPPGTAGWVPGGFNGTTSAISPGNRVIAAYAEQRPVAKGRTRLYLLQLARPRGPAVPVPSSASFLWGSTAWTATGSWLLYQGPRRHLWAYQSATGAVRPSTSPYSGIVAVPAPQAGQSG